jgi:hypothetical protein
MSGTPNHIARLNSLTDKLARMADWREDLAARIWRTTMRTELVGLDAGEQERLADEVRAFIGVACAIAQRIPGSLVDVAHDEDEKSAA